MNFVLFANNKDLYSSRRLLLEAESLGLNCSHIAPNNTLFDFDAQINCEQTLLFHRSTGMLYDDFDLLISEQFEKAGAISVNKTEVIKKLRDKEQQSLFFRSHDISMIPTLSLRGRPNSDHIEKIKSLGSSESFIVKTVRGNQGIGVNLINGQESLASLLETFWALGDQRFIIQPYLKAEREYRILFCQGKILGIIEKKEKGNDFRKNSHRAPAKAIEENELSKDILSLAQKAYYASQAAIAGIDIMVTSKQIYLLELNLVPGFKQMEELTLNNIAFEFIKSSLEKK